MNISNLVIFLLFTLIIYKTWEIFTKKDYTKNNHTKNSNIKNNKNNLNNTKWKVISINGLEIKDNNPTVEFSIKENNSEVRISGFAGCNRYFGSVQSISKTNGNIKPIKFTPLGSTLMACPTPQMRIETNFLQAMEKVTYYQIKGNELILYNSNKTPIIKLTKE